MKKLSEEMLEKLQYVRVCQNCPVLGKDMLLWKKKRCLLCGNMTRRYKMPEVVKGKDGKKRFPRELPISKEFETVVQQITDRTRDYDCPGVVTAVTKGPVVTEYEFTPDKMVRVKKLKSLNEDLALALKVDTVTIRRIPGKSAMGISIPNAERMEVTFESCWKNILPHRDTMALPLNMGISTDGTPYVEDLAKYPHLLVSGSTGAGKSVFINQILTGLLSIRTPKELKLCLVDPKTVELFPYAGMPHLMHEPVSTDWGCFEVMDNLIQEMKRRTANLHLLKANNIQELNARLKKEAAEIRAEANKLKDGAARFSLEKVAKEKEDQCWPYILLVIDEMAEIVLNNKKEFIVRLASIAQMARAAGISLIAATQRPSVDVLPGKIKVNFLGRASFRVPSGVDSKTILGFKGAETLLGQGDLFIVSPDKTGLQRIHVPNCKRENRDQMLKLSLEHGHENSVPADHMSKTAAPLLKKEGNGKAGKAMVN